MPKLNLPLKKQKSLINQGIRTKNKHRFYDTVSYHNYGAYLVGMTGFEPATSWSQTRRATNCATSRY